MDNLHLNGVSKLRSNPSTGQTSLPPKCPSPAISQSSTHSATNLNGQVQILRSCSATVLTEEPPPWFEELLDEPETPVNRGHRRSSSDPITYLDANSREKEYWLRNITEGPSWGFQRSSHLKDLFQASSDRNPSASHEHQNSLWRSSINSTSFPGALEEDAIVQTSALPSSRPEQSAVPLTSTELQSLADSASHNAESSSGASNGSHIKPSGPSPAFKTEPKRAKQHNGRRSRVRKLQYIAELERNVQALQAEGLEVSAELEFLDQQNLILSMENRALKQRIESLSKVQLIKSMEQEILERELVRLQYLYHQQNLQLHQQQLMWQRQPVHRRARSCDIDSRFANLSLELKEPGPSSDAFTVPLQRM